MVADLYTILQDLKDPLSFPDDDNNRLKPSAMMENDATIKTMRALTNTIISKEKKGLPELDSKTKFYIFLLTVNKHFDLKKNKLTKGQLNHIKSLAQELNISPEIDNAVMKFYHTDGPYRDTVDTVYIAFELSDQLVRSKGVNIYFTNRTPGEVIYLKYIEALDLFLSKKFVTTHSYNSVKEEVSIRELNIITEDNYSELSYDMPSFNELKNRLKQFNPLQRVEISESRYNPRITLDPDKGLISISGTSSPISTTVYFDPIFEWLNLFDMSGKEILNIYFHFNYYNTYTAKFLVNFVWQCSNLSKKGKAISIYWHYDKEDEEMKEFGEYLQTQFNREDEFHILEIF